MKKKFFTENTVRTLIFIAMVVLFVSGAFIAIRSTVLAQRALENEHDNQMEELSSTVDHNISSVLSRCRVELDDLLSSDGFYLVEQLYLTGENEELLRTVLRDSPVLLMDYAERIVVSDGESFILSSVESDKLDYTVLPDGDNDDIAILKDNNSGEYYFALTYYCKAEGLIYYMLAVPELFFERVAPANLYEDNWVVVYDSGSGLTVSNNIGKLECNIHSGEDMLNRKDGLTVIYKQEQLGEEGVHEYTYTDSKNQLQTIRIYVVPKAESDNSAFTVAVATYKNTVAEPVRRLTVYAILSAAMIAFSAAGALYMLMHSHKRERELAQEIAAAEKQKQLSEDMLKKQQELAHHQKLETIGTMTAGIAHEFNNMLAPIMGNSMLILEKSRTVDGEIFDNALEIYQASSRAKELILQISKLTRKQSAASFSPISPRKLIADVLNMSATSTPGNITAVQEINTDCRILGDESQLAHMLLNLVINATHVMTPEGGTLTVSADSDGESVWISVADTGKGIPKESLEYIFEPFYTTKEVGKGTGLGLSISQRIATNHGGSLTAENRPEGGAKFTFTAPVYKEEKEEE